MKHECRVDIERQDKELQLFCAAHKRQSDGVILGHIKSTRISLNLLHTTRAEKSLRWSSAKFYMQKDRVGSMLAVKHSPQPRLLVLPKIRCSSEEYIQDPQKALAYFHKFYSQLYQPAPLVNLKYPQSFIASVKIPKLATAHRELMDSPISVEEVLLAIKLMKWTSSLGSQQVFRTILPKIFHHFTVAPYLLLLLTFECPADWW